LFARSPPATFLHVPARGAVGRGKRPSPADAPFGSNAGPGADVPSSQSDFILRLIEQTGAALRRLRERLARGVPAGEVVEEARAVQAELFGAMWPTLRSVDPATATSLVTDSMRRELWSELLRVEAQAHRRLGDEEHARALESQAAALLDSRSP
jgi:hypothetical protein